MDQMTKRDYLINPSEPSVFGRTALQSAPFRALTALEAAKVLAERVKLEVALGRFHLDKYKQQSGTDL